MAHVERERRLLLRNLAERLNRVRTGEWAAYRMSGTSPRSLFVLLSLEQALLAGCLALSGALPTLAAASSLVSPVATAGIVLAAAALWVIAGVVMSVDLPLRQPTNLAKDR